MAIQKSKRLQPLHPGEVLKEVLTDAGLTVNALALALRVPANRIGGVVKGQRGITGDTALRLVRYWGTSAQMWMNLQAKMTSLSPRTRRLPALRPKFVLVPRPDSPAPSGWHRPGVAPRRAFCGAEVLEGRLEPVNELPTFRPTDHH